jgi:hypothetical protein
MWAQRNRRVAAEEPTEQARQPNLLIVSSRSPPANPELNPTENIQQYRPESYPSNRIFRDYDDVVEAASSVWSKLIT